MRKKICLFVMVLSMLISIPVSAFSERSASVIPTLSFSGNTAICSVFILGNTATDEIEVEIELWQGSTLIDSWSDSGEAYIDWKENVTVVKGKTYTLKVYATINGEELPMVDVAKTCK